MCASGELIQDLSRAFDADHDGQLNEAQVAMLYTSMVLNPEAILLRVRLDLRDIVFLVNTSKNIFSKKMECHICMRWCIPPWCKKLCHV